MSKIKGTIIEAFEKLKNSMFIRYKGCLISKQGGKFIWMNVPHETLEEAKAAIDEGFDLFNHNIIKPK